MELEATIQIDGADIPCGRLCTNARRGIETASFTYHDSYLSNPQAFALAPDMPLIAGAVHSQGSAMFRAFMDCMPDRWGCSLMGRAERALRHVGSRPCSCDKGMRILPDRKRRSPRIRPGDGTRSGSVEEDRRIGRHLALVDLRDGELLRVGHRSPAVGIARRNRPMRAGRG